MHSAVLSRTEAPVMEVFASIQGEGLYVGEPQVFLRMAGCPLRCAWCDTPGSWTVRDEGEARIEALDGTQREVASATPFQAVCWVASAEPGAPRTISITGGEPLLWPQFVLGLRAVAGERRLHLETAGAHPAALEQVLASVDHVSLDLKLPGDLGTPVPVPQAAAGETLPTDAESWRTTRRACLRLIKGRDACTKLIVTGEHLAADWRELLEDQAELALDVPLFIQPVTACAGVRAASPELLCELAEEARELGLTVRVVPQVHRALGIA